MHYSGLLLHCTLCATTFNAHILATLQPVTHCHTNRGLGEPPLATKSLWERADWHDQIKPPNRRARTHHRLKLHHYTLYGRDTSTPINGIENIPCLHRAPLELDRQSLAMMENGSCWIECRPCLCHSRKGVP